MSGRRVEGARSPRTAGDVVQRAVDVAGVTQPRREVERELSHVVVDQHDPASHQRTCRQPSHAHLAEIRRLRRATRRRPDAAVESYRVSDGHVDGRRLQVCQRHTLLTLERHTRPAVNNCIYTPVQQNTGPSCYTLK